MKEQQSKSPVGMMKGVLGREFPCPVCGYDLRASPGGLCPECGNVVPIGERFPSRIPWVYREKIGSVRAYLATLWFLLRHTRELGHERASRHRRSDAEGFQRLSILFSVLIGTILGRCIVESAPTDALLRIAKDHFWLRPLFVLMDSWWSLLPLACGLWIGLRIALAGARWASGIGIPDELERRRAQRVALYLSGFAPLVVFFLGCVLLGRMPDPGIYAHFVRQLLVKAAAKFSIFVAIPCGAGIFLGAPLMLAASIRNRRGLRNVAALAYAPISALMVVLPIAACLWLAGYVAMVIRSAMR